MKSKEEVQQLAKKSNAERGIDSAKSMLEREYVLGYTNAYTQCQEDMADIMLVFEEIWQQMHGKTDESGDMIYVPPILRQKIKQIRQ
jgi:hypothetical protein